MLGPMVGLSSIQLAPKHGCIDFAGFRARVRVQVGFKLYLVTLLMFVCNPTVDQGV